MGSLLKKKLFAAVAISAVGALGFAAAAVADDVANNLDPTVDADKEALNLTAGGSNGSVVLRIVTRDGDGKNGCNLTGSTTATFSVSSSNPSIASVSPSSVTFDSCGATRTLTVTPDAVGTTDVTLTQTANTTAGSFNPAPAAFTVNVGAAQTQNSAPVLSNLEVEGTDSSNCEVDLSVDVEDADGDDVDGSIAWGDTQSDPFNVEAPYPVTVEESHSYGSAGEKDIEVTAEDSEGESAVPVAETVEVFNVPSSGILQPINSSTPRSMFKAGSTVPVKIGAITACDGTVLGANIVPTIALDMVDGSVTNDDVVIESVSPVTATNGKTMRWDATASQYIYNLSTKGLNQGTYRVSVADASLANPITARFNLRK